MQQYAIALLVMHCNTPENMTHVGSKGMVSPQPQALCHHQLGCCLRLARTTQCVLSAISMLP